MPTLPPPTDTDADTTDTSARTLPQNHRLVVVTNREPYELVQENNHYRLNMTTGGLVTALEPVLNTEAHAEAVQGLWISWEGATPLQPEQRSALEEHKGELPYTVATVPLTKKEITYYYNGFANDLLWPLFHYFVGQANFTESRNWPNYVSANQKFADAVMENAQPGDWTWVHDYQLLLVPQLIREASPQHRIGFFNHIPFPSYELFRTLPYRRELLRGMLGSDLVGFHTRDYANHFLKCVSKLLSNEATVDWKTNQIHTDGRVVTVGAFPISLDVATLQQQTKQPAVQQQAETLRGNYERLGVSFLGVGVDRLDYTKGIIERLEALEAFFIKYPEFKKRVQFVQIAAPSRAKVGTYQTLRDDVEQTVGRINGRLAEGTWTPIQFFCRNFSKEELLPYFMAADFAMVTPIRDGMNLVAKEYCAIQKDNRGALILPEAFVVNPYSQHRMVEAIYKVLTLPSDDKQTRMAACRQQVESRDIHHWVNSYLSAFQQAVAARQSA